MPLIKYKCSNTDCGKEFTAFKRAASSILNEEKCKFCGSVSKRILSSPNSSSKITIDNGLQAKAVEVDPNIMELREEWSKPRNRGD